MTKEQFAARLKQACASVISAEQELTEIDSKFGDADHGLTMTKIAKAISDAVDQSDGGIQAMLDDAATAVMSLNGGSAVPLWNTWLDGMQEAAPEGEEIDVPGLQAVFAQALEELNDMSGAKVGDKTMMDALIPASEAVAAYAGADEAGLFAAAAQAAAAGAENSKNFVSKFGRAKSYGQQTIGTPDAGAVSIWALRQSAGLSSAPEDAGRGNPVRSGRFFQGAGGQHPGENSLGAGLPGALRVRSVRAAGHDQVGGVASVACAADVRAGDLPQVGQECILHTGRRACADGSRKSIRTHSRIIPNKFQ